jgi:CRISPR-associated protein Csh2
MSEAAVRTGEVLFVKSVKGGIPNRDPLRESDARRLFGPDDGRISLSDVSVKRDVRDYVLARFPDGGPDKDRFVFVRKQFNEDQTVLLGRGRLADAILKEARAGKQAAPADPSPVAEAGARGRRRAVRTEEGDIEKDLLAATFDMRVFGAVFSVESRAFNRVGPVQLGWAHSLHPAETKYVQGTVCMPSRDAEPTSGGEETGKTQGTIWTMYQLPFAVFAMPGVLSAPIASATGMTAADVDLLLEGLWKGTLARQARGRGIQQPLFLLHVEYNDPFFRIGYLEEGLRLIPGRDEDGRSRWLGGQPPTDLADVQLDVTKLAKTLEEHHGQTARVRLWHDPKLTLVGAVAAEAGSWPEGA